MNINFRINNTTRIYIIGVIFLKLPQITFSTTYEIIPNIIPLDIEYVRGIIIIQMNTGIDSLKSSNGIFLIGSSIRRPTITSAGVVAANGIERNTGQKNKAAAKHIAMENAVRPERPPWATPAALST